MDNLNLKLLLQNSVLFHDSHILVLLISIFPSPNNLQVGKAPSSPLTAPTTLLILDGTWHQARKIWTGSPCLHGVRRVKLCLSSESEYVVRSQPRAGCLSTLECAAHSLARLEGRPEVVDQLLAPLRAMCNSQIHHGGRQGHPSTFVTENNQYRKRKPRYTAGHTTDDSKDLSLQIELEETGDLELACVS